MRGMTLGIQPLHLEDVQHPLLHRQVVMAQMNHLLTSWGTSWMIRGLQKSHHRLEEHHQPQALVVVSMLNPLQTSGPHQAHDVEPWQAMMVTLHQTSALRQARDVGLSETIVWVGVTTSHLRLCRGREATGLLALVAGDLHKMAQLPVMTLKIMSRRTCEEVWDINAVKLLWHHQGHQIEKALSRLNTHCEVAGPKSPCR